MYDHTILSKGSLGKSWSSSTKFAFSSDTKITAAHKIDTQSNAEPIVFAKVGIPHESNLSKLYDD